MYLITKILTFYKQQISGVYIRVFGLDNGSLEEDVLNDSMESNQEYKITFTLHHYFFYTKYYQPGILMLTFCH